MKFVVKSRSSTGKIVSTVVEAETRSKLFDTLHAKNITAICVSEYRKKYAWHSHYALILSLFIVVGCLFVLVLWLRSSNPNELKEDYVTDSPISHKALVSSSSHHQIVKQIAESEPTQNSPMPIWERPIPEDLDDESRAAYVRKMAYEKKLSTDSRLKKFLATAKPKKTLYKSGTEQVIDWIFTTRVGDLPPPPLPEVSKIEIEHIDEILDAMDDLTNEEDPSIVERKQIVAEVKKELKSYIANGGRVGDFLSYYYDELTKAYERKSIVENAIHETVTTSDDPAFAIEFTEKANELLESQGIFGVELSEGHKDILEERLRLHENQ